MNRYLPMNAKARRDYQRNLQILRRTGPVMQKVVIVLGDTTILTLNQARVSQDENGLTVTAYEDTTFVREGGGYTLEGKPLRKRVRGKV